MRHKPYPMKQRLNDKHEYSALVEAYDAKHGFSMDVTFIMILRKQNHQ